MGALLALFVACDGNLGCLACGSAFDYPDPPPPGGEILRDVALASVQERGVEFIASHMADILRENLPTRTAAGIERAIIYLPEEQIGSSVALTIRDGCIGDAPPESCPPRFEDSDASLGPTFRSKLELNLDTIDDAVDTAFLPASGDLPDRARISLYDLDVFVDMALVIEAAGGNATCHIKDDALDKPAVHIERLRFEVTLEVDADNKFVGDVENVEIELGFFDSASLLNLDVSPCNGGACDDPTCHDGWTDFECPGLCVMGDFVFETVEFLTDVLSPLLEWVAPPLVELAMEEIFDQVNGQPLAVSGQYDVGTLFADPELAGLLLDPTELYFGAIPNDDAFEVSGPAAGRGMGLWLDAGTLATASSCVPTISPPAYEDFIGLQPVFDGTVQITDPLSGDTRQEAFHLALGVSAGMLEQAGYAFYQLGGTCLVLTPERVLEASDGAFLPTLETLSLFSPGLLDLGPPDAPVIFAVHPTASPSFSLGTGEIVDTPDGEAFDSHVKIDFGEVGLSFYVEADGTLVRLATVAGDLKMALSLVRTQDNTVALGLDSLTITDMVEVYNEIAGATDFAGLSEVMFNLAFGSLVERLSGINLDLAPAVSDMLGGAPVYARINTVAREGEAGDGWLVAYFTFCDDADLLDPTRPPCYSPPQASAPPAPPRFAPGVDGVVVAGEAQLLVDGRRLWRVGVDGTGLSGLKRAPSGSLRLAHPMLRLPGIHTIRLVGHDPVRYWEAPAHFTLEVIVERPGFD